MALNKIVYGVRTPISPRIFSVHGVFDHHPKSRKSVAPQSKIYNFRRLQLQGKLICNKRNKFRICRFSLGIADCISKEPLEGIQVASVPGYFDGMADGAFHSTGCGLEGLCHLGVEHLGDGISLACGQQEGA